MLAKVFFVLGIENKYSENKDCKQNSFLHSSSITFLLNSIFKAD
ncbi:Uncharacterised protein [Candidatus Venteria ishoeyi]|uniref:Uncharacterized protein n=1 Tax=Candidatus Venteria ishoeyi TaxID=1899563 RepID=A0A1H6F5I1_9GAMM|nr:Uncharacterised protein [Candidatus Venteria ishoeyi]